MSVLSLRGSLKNHLIVLVLAALVPMLLWAGGLMVWNSLRERAAIERGLSETVRALAQVIDQDLQLTTESLISVGLARVLAERNYVSFDQTLRKLVARHPNWLYVALLDAQGRQIINTARPLGTALPDIPAYGDNPFARAYRDVLATGHPIVSDLFDSKVTNRPVVVVGVPVLDDDGSVGHVLMAGLLPERLAELLQRQEVPAGWLATVLDGHGLVLARSVQHDKFVGRPALGWFLKAIAGRDSGIARGPSLHGPFFTNAFQRSRVSDWVVTFGAPSDIFTATLNRAMAVTVGFGLLVTVGSIVLALGITRRILAPVQALTAAARPFVPERRQGPQYGIAELDALHGALDGLAEDLERSRARFQKVFSVAPVMLFVCDAHWRLTEVNDAWLRILGYGRDEVLGRDPADFHTAESRDQALRVMRPHFLETGAVDDLPCAYVTKAGDVRDVLVSLRAETDANGTIVRSIGAVRDVTEARRAQKALARAVEEAAQANDAKSRFLAAASHDLRQPLQALNLYLGVLKGADSDAPVMPAIRQCVDSLSGLLDDMLDVSRLDAGTVRPKLVEVPVARLMERVAAAWRIQAEVKGLRLDFSHCKAVVMTDPALMDRVLSNLVGNAVRYTERGRILVGCRAAGPDHVRLEVWDTGIGIPGDKLDEVFEEFRQLGNAERRSDRGTGLGLAIVRRIVGLLGHDMTVRSWPGKGSVFSVTLPAKVSCAAVPPAEEAAPRSGRRCILVVDDEAHVRAALTMVLKELGHDVTAADGLEAALARLDEVRPQLVIADFRLGGNTTGIEVVKAVRKRLGDDVPAVVLTGDTDPATIRRIVGAGLHLLHKPLQVEALEGFLRQVA